VDELPAIRRSAYHLRRIGKSQIEAMSKVHFVSLDVQLNTSAREDLSTSAESAFFGQVDYFWIARQPGEQSRSLPTSRTSHYLSPTRKKEIDAPTFIIKSCRRYTVEF
jgi:hypothetical protein